MNLRLLRRNDLDREPGYSVAMSNRLFTDDKYGLRRAVRLISQPFPHLVEIDQYEQPVAEIKCFIKVLFFKSFFIYLFFTLQNYAYTYVHRKVKDWRG